MASVRIPHRLSQSSDRRSSSARSASPQMTGEAAVDDEEQWAVCTVQIVGYTRSDEFDKHVEYVIQVTQADDEWQVQKRYKQFHALYEKLQAEFPAHKFDFPAKRFAANLMMSKGQLEKRQGQLEVFLQNANAVIQIRRSSCFQTFLHEGKISSVVLKEGWLWKCPVGVGSWRLRYFELHENGLLYYTSEKKDVLKGKIVFLESSCFRGLQESEAVELRRPASICFKIFGGNERWEKRWFVLAPNLEKGPNPFVGERAAAAVCNAWMQALATVLKPAELQSVGASMGDFSQIRRRTKSQMQGPAIEVGTFVTVDPAFTKTGSVVPVCFEWHGHPRLIKDSGLAADADAEFRVEYIRRVLVGQSDVPDWQVLQATVQDGHEGEEDAEIVVSSQIVMLPAKTGYQSRWKVRPRPTLPEGERRANCLVVQVNRAEALPEIDPNDRSLFDSKSAAPGDAMDPYASVRYGTQYAETRVRKKTTTPDWNQEFRFPITAVDPRAPVSEQDSALGLAAKTPVEITVHNWDALSQSVVVGTVEIVPDHVASDVLGLASWYPLGPASDPLTVSSGAGDGAGAAQTTSSSKRAPNKAAVGVHTGNPHGLGEVQISVNLVYDDDLDCGWRYLLSPLRRAPNVVSLLRNRVPLLQRLTAGAPPAEWHVRNIPVGPSHLSRRLKMGLQGLQDMVPNNAWDIVCGVQLELGVYRSNILYLATSTDRAMRESMARARDPRHQYMQRCKALASQFNALRMALAYVHVDLNKVSRDPFRFFFPSKTEPDLADVARLQKRDWDIWKLRVEDDANQAYPEWEHGMRVSVPDYRAIVNAVASKRPAIRQSFALPMRVVWASPPDVNLPSSVSFRFAPVCLRPATVASSSLLESGSSGDLMGSLSCNPYGSTRRRIGSFSGDTDASSESGFPLGDDELQMATASLEELGGCSVDDLESIYRDSPFVRQILLKRMESRDDGVIAVVHPDDDELWMWAASQDIACADLGALCAMKKVRFAVLDSLVDVAHQAELGAGERVRGVHLSMSPWTEPQGSKTRRDKVNEAYAKHFARLAEECTLDMAYLESEWMAVQLELENRETRKFAAKVKIPPGIYAYQWVVDGWCFFEQGYPTQSKAGPGAPPASIDETENFKVFQVTSSVEFGLGTDVGY